MKLRTEFFKVLIVELSSVIGDDGMQQSESVDDEFLDEVFHFLSVIWARGSASIHLMK